MRLVQLAATVTRVIPEICGGILSVSAFDFENDFLVGRLLLLDDRCHHG